MLIRRFALCALLVVLPAIVRADDGMSSPYQLPTLSGEVDIVPPKSGGYAPSQIPRIDANRLFDAVVQCYPAPSWFRGELSAVIRAGTGPVTDLSNLTSSEKVYLGLVSRVPLFAPAEIDRERERESIRRMRIAEAISKLDEAVTRKAIATRLASLYRSLESRSYLRVKYGIADTSEQAGYLEKLASQEEAIARAEAEITAARLTLRGMCQDDRAEGIDSLIGSMLKP